MTLGLRDTVRVVGEEKKIKVIDGKYFELSTVSEKNPFLKFLELFLIWGRRAQLVPSDQIHSCMVCAPLLRRGRPYSLKEPNSVSIFTNAELLPTLLQYVISDGGAKQSILDGIRSLHIIQAFNVCITHANLIASVGGVNVLHGHRLTYEDGFLVELVLPCAYGPVKAQTPLSGAAKEI